MKYMVTPLDYEKLSDDLYWLNDSVVVRFVVSLARADKENNRMHFHREFSYNSKYLDKGHVITLRRSFSYYITFNILKDYESTTIIGVKDILLFRAKLNEVINWFNNGTFALKRKKLVIPSRPAPIIISGLADGKFIQFDPIVMEDEETKAQQQGIRISFINDNYADLSIDRFYGFYYLITSINMYQSAQLLLNYLGRPECGTNLYDFNNEGKYRDVNQYDEQEPPEPISKNRDIANRPKPASYFDKIDKLGGD